MERKITEINERDQRLIEETTEAWQSAIARASEAEKQNREFEKTVSSLQEQLHVTQVQQQLWAPERSEIPPKNSSTNPVNDESMRIMEEILNDEDEDMEVNIINVAIHSTSSSVYRHMSSVLPFPNPSNSVDQWGAIIQDQMLDWE